MKKSVLVLIVLIVLAVGGAVYVFNLKGPDLAPGIGRPPTTQPGKQAVVPGLNNAGCHKSCTNGTSGTYLGCSPIEEGNLTIMCGSDGISECIGFFGNESIRARPDFDRCEDVTCTCADIVKSS